MAKQTTERVLTIPLRREWVKQSRIHRVPRGVNVIREYIFRHMKTEDIKISTALNEFLWTKGIKRPPAQIKVKVRLEEGQAYARLPDEKILEPEKKGKDAKAKESAKTQKADEKNQRTEQKTPEKHMTTHTEEDHAKPKEPPKTEKQPEAAKK